MKSHQHRERIARSISWGHWFTFANIFLALLIGSIYFLSATSTGSFLTLFYTVVSWLGHFAFLPFAFFIVLLFPFCLALPYSRVLRAIGAIVASFALFALLLDAVFFHYYQFHLNSYALAQLATDAEKWVSGGSFILLIVFILSFLSIFAIQILLTNVTWKKLESLRRVRSLRVFPAIFIGAFFISHSIHIWADANLFRPITQQDDLFPLSYPTTAKSLMSRHGWIDISSINKLTNPLEQSPVSSLRYPVSPLLCARKSHTEPTLVVAFNQLSTAQVSHIQATLPELTSFPGYFVGHPQTAAGIFQLSYGVSALYQASINQGRQIPAYAITLQDLDYSIHWVHSANLEQSLLPTALQTQADELTEPFAAHSGMRIVFADNQDLAQVMKSIEAQLKQQPQTQLYITAVTPHAIEPSASVAATPLTTRLAVPLLTRQVTIYPERQLAGLNDIIPTVVSQYMSCADKSHSYSNGQHLNSPTSGYPRATSIGPNIYLFEPLKTSVLTATGDVAVFDNEGTELNGQQPTASALIQGLNELQRFTAPQRK